VIYVALVAATDRSAFDDALVLVRQRRLRATPSADAPASADPAPVSAPDRIADAYIPFDDIGRRRAHWEHIADGWNASWATDRSPPAGFEPHRGDVGP
jgi:hypothetical protein